MKYERMKQNAKKTFTQVLPCDVQFKQDSITSAITECITLDQQCK